MKAGLVAAAVVALGLAAPAFAHRLDEYLQAATIDVGKDRVVVQVRLTPGVEVVSAVLADVDPDGDGVVSEAEQRSYAQSVLRDVSLSVDAKPVQLRLVSSAFPSVERMKDGLGDIQFELDATVPPGSGGVDRRLVFENRHRRAVAAYLVNCLIPSDPDIRVTAQHRNPDQSTYQLDYTQWAAARPGRLSLASWLTILFWIGVNALMLLAWIVAVLQRRLRRGRQSS